MTDSFDVYITLLKEDLDKFGIAAGYKPGCKWWDKLYKEVRAPQVVTVSVLYLNDAFYSARKKASDGGLVFCGTHDSGSEYPSLMFVSAKKRMVEKRLDRYGRLVTEQNPSVESYKKTQEFNETMSKVEEKFYSIFVDFTIKRAFPIRQHIHFIPLVFFKYKSPYEFFCAWGRVLISSEKPMSSTSNKSIIVILPGGVEIEMIWCPPGSYIMGSPVKEEGRGNDETQHLVTITKGYWIGKYQITNLQYAAITGVILSQWIRSPNYPAEDLSWEDSQDFVFNLNATYGKDVFRLPTEAEWEYACRAGTSTSFAGNLDDLGWYGTNSNSEMHEIGKKSPNAWGLHDMHGNAWEWCQDYYGAYTAERMIDPKGAIQGKEHVLRGGSFLADDKKCRSAARYNSICEEWSQSGMRLVMDQIPLEDCKGWIQSVKQLMIDQLPLEDKPIITNDTKSRLPAGYVERQKKREQDTQKQINESAKKCEESSQNVNSDNPEILTKVVGVTYDNQNGVNRQKIIACLALNSRLTLSRDHENKYDPNAISVLDESGNQVGFINKELATSLAPKIDAGKVFTVSFVSFSGGDHGYSRGINIRIQ